MKSKVIIENGETTIVLTPENEFETDVLEKVRVREKCFNIHTSVDADYNYGNYKNYRLNVNIKEIR